MGTATNERHTDDLRPNAAVGHTGVGVIIRTCPAARAAENVGGVCDDVVMDTISLVAKPDHILKLAGIGDPTRAIIELIWNGLDAEATNVEVELTFDELDGVSGVTVTDNGHGMNRQACIQDFSMLGGSWKASALVSPHLKRRMQGRNGQGRLRAFALGNDVHWNTIAKAVTSGMAETTIRGNANNPVNFTVSEDAVVPVAAPSGCRFESRNPAKYVNRLTGESTTAKLTATFALFLLSNPDVKILFRGKPLDPRTAWLDSVEVELPLGDSLNNPLLRVIEWKSDVSRTLALCDSVGNELAQHTPGVQAPGYSFTAYIMWDGFKDHLDTIALADFDEGVVAEIMTSARNAIREHFLHRDVTRRQRQVIEWKEQKVYPYPDEPQNSIEVAERGLFDEVATTVARKLPKSPEGRRTTLRLLREIVASDPEKVLPMVDEIFRLPKAEQEQMRRLLEGTSLSAIVKATSDVTDRFRFLAGLKTMVFDPKVRKLVKERAELHKILARETWVFGDEYALMASDRGLDEVLNRHLAILGKRVDTTSTKPVRRESGQRGIVDLVLGRSSRSSGNHREHLVVELKAPRVKIGAKEATQIRDYAEAVTSDPQFKSTNVTWNFWVISTDLATVVQNDADAPTSPAGCISSWNNGVKVWAKRWNEIISECEARLNYYRDCLDYEASLNDELEYFRRLHADVAPPALLQRRDLSA